MIDSELVGVGAEMAPGLADLPVVPQASGEGEQPEPDPGAEAGQGAGAVALEAELALAGPKHRLDPLAHSPEGAEARLLVLAVGAKERGPAIGHPALKFLAGKALVGDDRVAVER